MARELLTGAILTLDRQRWILTCVPLRDLAELRGRAWKPGYGIHCDDLATLAEQRYRDDRLLFLTECKGTTMSGGLSRNTEAKMFYQLARTYEKLRRAWPLDSRLQLGGVISVIVNHGSRRVTVNVLDRSTAFAGNVPDAWMYPFAAPGDF